MDRSDFDGSPVIVTAGLTKRYGETLALDALDLDVPAGCIFGFLGPNGAGKSTTIRLLLGSIRPTSGMATILGIDVITRRTEVHRHVGYLPSEFRAYRDLTGRQYLDHLARLRGGVEPRRITDLAERFSLDLGRKVSELSHGNRQKLGIIQACMHQPALLVLDEPTQGLDPLMQQNFLDLLREHRDAGRTVFLSSHVLSEVEEVADTVAIIRAGRLATITDIETLKRRTRRRVALRFVDGATSPAEALRALPSVTAVDVVDGTVEVVVEGSMADLLKTAAPFGVERIVSNEVDLEGVFLEYYAGA